MNTAAEVKAEEGTSVHDQIAPVAEQTLAHFEKTSAAASSALSSDRPITIDVFASVNTLNSDAMQKSLDAVNQATRADLLQLAAEPAIARVVVRNSVGELKTIFIARAGGVDHTKGEYLTASYRSPLGRLASLEIGDELEVGKGGSEVVYKVVNRALLRPRKTVGEWDAHNTVFKSEDAGPVTIVSLRAALAGLRVNLSDLDLLDSLLAGDRETRNIIDGLTRSVVEKIGLRDQSVVDSFQDRIFRLPLDVRLAIMGPPGTGKTTTLIKRLGQKLDHRHLEEEEKALVFRSIAGTDGHDSSWMMFTPTELLKQYVKEAFNREKVPASDFNLQTWGNYRKAIARQDLGLLRSGGRRGAILREQPQSTTPETLERQIEWFEDFDRWQMERFWEDLKEHAQRLAASGDRRISALGTRLASVLPGSPDVATASTFVAIAALEREISTLASELRRVVDVRTRESLASHLRGDRALLDDFAEFLATLSDAPDEIDDPELEEDEDEEESSARKGGREQAFEAYGRVAKAQARAAVSKRPIGRRTRTGQILGWLGERSLSAQDRKELGEHLLVLGALRRFSNPVRRYLSGLLGRYRRFRRDRQAEGVWYVATPLQGTDLTTAEVDLLILAMLRAGRALLADRTIAGMIDESRFATLRSIRGLLRNQIVVDEAMDFSPLELASMAALTDPALDAFVMCGDFNQRITATGIRSIDELRWVAPAVDIRPITVTYRHSRALANLSESLVELAGGEPTGVKLPDGMVGEGFAPLLAVGLGRDAVVDWLADRIREIDAHMSGRLPSIAILVSSEADVGPIAEELDAALASSNIPCVACPKGQVRGQDNEVRVFDVQHIKGLEFEAVFFVDVDALAQQQPELFDKFLYVGATRAATYLGLTCRQASPPEKLRPLASQFRDRWTPA